MKQFKRARVGPEGQSPGRSEFLDRNLHRPEATMHTDAALRKSGRLSREDQRRLGDILKRVYDDVIRQGVPDRFKTLLDELDVAHEGGEQTASRIHGAGDRNGQADHLVEAEQPGQKGLASNKGSH
jgi:Anti-sigma factor NepR